MDERKNDRKRHMYVAIETNDGKVIWGMVFLNEDERLQDILNDSRDFLPVSTLINSRQAYLSPDGDDYKLTIIKKSFINKVEEVERISKATAELIKKNKFPTL